LREVEPEALAERDEAVEEASREDDVVVDGEEPVGVAVADPLEEPVQVLELASAEPVQQRAVGEPRVGLAGRAERHADAMGVRVESIERVREQRSGPVDRDH
jgi:hypothetical protein